MVALTANQRRQVLQKVRDKFRLQRSGVYRRQSMGHRTPGTASNTREGEKGWHAAVKRCKSFLDTGSSKTGKRQLWFVRWKVVAHRLQLGWEASDFCAEALAAADNPLDALKAYEAERVEPTGKVVRTNRSSPPDVIIMKVEELVGDRPFDNLDDYVTQDELRDLSDRYKQIAGFSKEALRD